MEGREKPELDSIVPTGEPTKSKKSPCPHCGDMITKQHLRRHIRRSHPSEMPSQVRFSCREASKLAKEKLHEEAQEAPRESKFNQLFYRVKTTKL